MATNVQWAVLSLESDRFNNLWMDKKVRNIIFYFYLILVWSTACQAIHFISADTLEIGTVKSP
jgi:hypothetical protein